MTSLIIRCVSLDQYTEEQKQGLVECCPTAVFDMEENSGNIFLLFTLTVSQWTLFYYTFFQHLV